MLWTGEAPSTPRIGTISAVAERQRGVIAAAQLYSLGLSETQVAVGTGAVLSDRSAADLWELRQSWSAQRFGCDGIDVAIRSRRGWRRSGLVVHRLPTLHDEKITIRSGIPGRRRPGLCSAWPQCSAERELGC